MIKAVLFDMNGVIIDDEHVHELAFHDTVQPYGIKLTHQDYLECCAGKTDRAGYESIAQKFAKKLDITTLLAAKSQTYRALFPIHKKSYPGVIDLIHGLATHCQVALTSSSSRAEVDLITNAFAIDATFTTTISGDDVTRGKPDPEPYQLTCQKLGIAPNEAVVIEDSKSGVMAAKAAGCFCIGITTTHTAADLSACDLIITQFSQLNWEIIAALGG